MSSKHYTYHLSLSRTQTVPDGPNIYRVWREYQTSMTGVGCIVAASLLPPEFFKLPDLPEGSTAIVGIQHKQWLLESRPTQYYVSNGYFSETLLKKALWTAEAFFLQDIEPAYLELLDEGLQWTNRHLSLTRMEDPHQITKDRKLQQVLTDFLPDGVLNIVQEYAQGLLMEELVALFDTATIPVGKQRCGGRSVIVSA